MELKHERGQPLNQLFTTPRAIVCTADCLDEPVFVVEEYPITGRVSSGKNGIMADAPGGWCVLVSDREQWWPQQFLDLSND